MSSLVYFHELGSELDFGSNDFVNQACQFIAEKHSSTNRMIVLCKNTQQIEILDEALWQLPTDRFIPHHMQGEGNGISPVELRYLPLIVADNPIKRNACLINYSAQVVDNPDLFYEVHDFVPIDELGKNDARERYSIYKKTGRRLEFIKQSAVNN